ELMDGVHQQHAAACMLAAGTPVGSARRPPVIGTLVDDGAKPNQSRFADFAGVEHAPRSAHGTGSAQLEEHRELEAVRFRELPEAAGLGGLECERLFREDVLACQ